MKYLDEFRDPLKVKILSEKIHSITRNQWNIMEVCGSQTHTILKYNLEELLPSKIKLLHGPGCPVCVTPSEKIDTAIAIGERKNIILATYGDMLRVPGSRTDMLSLRSAGGDIRIIYSPLDAVKLAQLNHDKQVVFFAIGFETTAPANASAVMQAKMKGINNFFVMSSQVLIPPAVELILSSNKNINALIAPGHVCTITGYKAYQKISAEYKIPITVTGFEPVDILEGILLNVEMLENGIYETANQYKRIVSSSGNLRALADMYRVFETGDRNWRGIGVIKNSGLNIRAEYSEFDAEKIFGAAENIPYNDSDCIAGEILRGIKRPDECKAFGTKCNQSNPLGAPMVSSEGACAAYFRYKIQRKNY